MRPDVTDAVSLSRKIADYRKKLDALTEARVLMYRARLTELPSDIWERRIHQLETELAGNYQMPERGISHEDYYKRLREGFPE